MKIGFKKNDDTVVYFDDERLSIAEARWIKREFGLNINDMMKGMRSLDVDSVLAVFSIALKRSGIVINSAEDIPVSDGETGYYDLLKSILIDDEEIAETVPNRRDRRKAVAKG